MAPRVSEKHSLAVLRPICLTRTSRMCYTSEHMATAIRSKVLPRKVSGGKRAIRTYDSALKYLFSQTDYERCCVCAIIATPSVWTV